MNMQNNKLRDHFQVGQNWLSALGVLSMLGTAAELTILGHYQEPNQILPYVSLLAVAWALRAAMKKKVSSRTIYWVRAMGIASVIVAVIGAALHYNANLGLRAGSPIEG